MGPRERKESTKYSEKEDDCCTIRDRILRNDLFGFDVKFNYNQKGDNKHVTCFGGCCSLLVKLVVIFIILCNVLLFVGPEATTYHQEKYSITDDGAEEMVQVDVQMNPSLITLKNGRKRMKYDAKTKRFIEIRFVQKTINFETGEETEAPFAAKMCSIQDYVEDESKEVI